MVGSLRWLCHTRTSSFCRFIKNHSSITHPAVTISRSVSRQTPDQLQRTCEVGSVETFLLRKSVVSLTEPVPENLSGCGIVNVLWHFHPPVAGTEPVPVTIVTVLHQRKSDRMKKLLPPPYGDRDGGGSAKRVLNRVFSCSFCHLNSKLTRCAKNAIGMWQTGKWRDKTVRRWDEKNRKMAAPETLFRFLRFLVNTATNISAKKMSK